MGWIGVDFDGTLAYYSGWQQGNDLGAPIIPMVRRVKKWLAEGKDVRIFTARVASDGADAREQERLIRQWCRKHLGRELPVTATKDFSCLQIWDDRAIQVRRNVGTPVLDNNYNNKY